MNLKSIALGIFCAAIMPQNVRAEILAAQTETSPIVPFVKPSGRPTRAECRDIVKSLRDVGFDQFMVYPSTGLEYEYLGEEFFRMQGTFFDEAERRGMKVWLYDEFDWPSGSARGRVPAENEACLYCELVASTNAAGKVKWEIVVSREINVDNFCLDTNNFEPTSVNRFMELTHREYARRFGKHMGTLIRGIFTDEPGHCSSAWRLKVPEGTVLRVPWWTGMEEEYRLASGGRDFRADFEEALKTGALATSDVFRIWTEIRSRRYRKTYFDPISDWCKTVGIESTGHLIDEYKPSGCAYANGLPLHTLQGLSKPAVDLIMSETGHGYEWITLAFAQSAALKRGRPGAVELFGLGPCDITFTIMRKLYWLCALHGIDTYFQGLYHQKAYRFNIKDSYAMFTSPTQPWFTEMPLLHEAAKEAAIWARKPFKCEIAVVYPQRQLGSYGVIHSGANPDLAGLCRELTWNQFTYELIEEDEKTERAVVLDWRDETLVERRSGRVFADFAAALDWLESRFPDRPRVKAAAGATRPGFVTRAYCDGSAVAVDTVTGEVIIARDGNLAPRKDSCSDRRAIAREWALSLSGPTCRRTWFWTAKADAQRETDKWLKREEKKEDGPRYPHDNMAKLVLTAPLKGVKFAIRRYPADRKFAVTMDGRPLSFPKPCASVAYAFDDLYAETEPMDIAAGEHIFELAGGKDGKLFMPVMWMVGDFSEREYGVLSPLPKFVRCGALAEQGLGSFAGVATYRAETSFAPGERLRIHSGGAVARVRFGGRDLGARGWAPFEWTIPADLMGRRLQLEIDIITSVRPIFGSEKSPDAKLDHALWVRSSLADPSPVGLCAAEIVKNP